MGAGLAPGIMAAAGVPLIAAAGVAAPPGGGPVLPVVVDGAAAGAVGALGFGAAPGTAPAEDKEASLLREVLTALTLKNQSPGTSRSSSTDKAKKDKGKKKKKKKKKSKGSDDSSTSSSSGSGRSAGKPNRKYMQWLPADHKKRKLDSAVVARGDGLHFKRRRDLLKFSSKYPGGLAAHFLHQVRRKLDKQAAVTTQDIISTDPTVWAHSQHGMKDVRDAREVQFLSKLLAEISLGRLPGAVDYIVMRIREIRMAKADKGTWEQAAAISLTPTSVSSNAALPDGAFTL